MAEKLQFYLLDLTYKVNSNRAEIYIFGKTLDNQKVILIDPHFKPYFYVIPKKSPDDVIRKLEKLELEKRGIKVHVTQTKVVKKQYKGRDIEAIKVYANLPMAVPALANEAKQWDIVSSCHEYDILFTRRYLIDKELYPMKLFEAEAEERQHTSKIRTYTISSISEIGGGYLGKQNILAFDLETYHTGGKIDPIKNPIIMISFYSQNFKKVLTYKKFKTKLDYIEFVDNEAHLLKRFKEIIKERNPDIITGYNSDGFDFPYLKERAKKYKIKLDIGLDSTEMRSGKGRRPKAQINGIIHIDIFTFIKKNIGQSLKTDSYKLDNVSEEILGEKKIDADISKLAQAWDSGKGLNLYAKYNLHDSILTYKLCERFLPNILEFTKMLGVTAFDVIRMSLSQIVESYLLRQAPKFNIIAPNKPDYDMIKKRRIETYPGAFVYEPRPGLYNDIIIFDFRSLYPTIISSHNIGPSTLNCSCCEDDAENVPSGDGEKGKYWFCKKRKSFIGTIIDDIITRRMRIKEIINKDKKQKDFGQKAKTALMLLDARQYSLKIMANSFYGYLGFFGARWYSIECARSVTAYGRYYITKVIDMAKETGFNVIYSDTDSIFLTLDSKTRKDAEVFAAKVNSKLPGIMELELEGMFPAGIFVSAKMGVSGAKKKYAMLSEEGEIKIKGFETIRSNWSQIAKEVQEEVLNIILKEKDKEKAFNYAREVMKNLAARKIPLKKVIMHTQLTKEIEEYESIGPHVAIAKKMRAKGMEIVPGMRIEYIICKGKGKIRDKARLPAECKEGEYDEEYYLNHQLIPAIDKIFEVLGYSKEQISSGGKQKDLKAFFG